MSGEGVAFDRSSESFPVKDETIYLGHCGIAPMYAGAAEEIYRFTDARVRRGAAALGETPSPLTRFRRVLAALLQVPATDVSLVKNTAEAMSIIANGYPFEVGDEIVSYVHEYPSNHYPWLIQKRRGATLKLLDDHDPVGDLPGDRPRGWSIEDLDRLVTDRTRIVAVSHVQFTSGFAADLEQLGRFCAERGIDLVVDVAQSLGSLPVHPEKMGIAALAGSGWKWLLGPVGSGVMYTSPAFREKIEVTVAGADVVTQGDDYLDHTWRPHADGRRFEYSTVQYSYAAALARTLEDIFVAHGPERIRAEIFRLQDLFLARLEPGTFRPVVFPSAHRSGILALIAPGDPTKVVQALAREGITISSRGGYLRIAPHVHNDDDEIVKAAAALSRLRV